MMNTNDANNTNNKNNTNNGSPSNNGSNKESPILALNRLLKQENIEIGTGPSGSITSRCRRESDCKLNKSSGAGNFKPIITSNSISTNSLITPPRTSLLNTISNNNNNNNTSNIININDIKNTITDDTNTINTNTMGGDTSPIRRLRKGSLPLPSLDPALANNNNNNNRIIDSKLTTVVNNSIKESANNNNINNKLNNNVISNIINNNNTNKINNSTNLKSIVKNNNNKIDIRKSGKNLMYYNNQHNQQQLNIIKINKQDTDGRLQLFIVDTKRTLKNASTELDGSTIYIEIAKRLVEIATQFYNCKQNEIDYENFAEELLSILNSTNFKVLGKCRELVIKLLTIIAKYARVIQLISFEKSTTTATSPIIEELELLKIDETAEPDNLQQLQLSSPPTINEKKEEPIKEISSMEQPLSSTSQLSPSECMIEKNPLNFQKSHYRCLSYSPKLLEQQLQQQQKLINQQIKTKNHNQLNPVQHQKYVKFELQKSPTFNQNLPTETTSTIKPPLISRKLNEQQQLKELPTTTTKTITSPTSQANESTDIIDEDNILSSSSDEESTSEEEEELTADEDDQVSEYSSDSQDEQDDSNYYNTNHHEIKKDNLLRKTKSISSFKKSHQHHFSTNSTGNRNSSKPLFLKDPRLNDLKTTSDEYILKRPLVRSKSFSPNKEGVEEETVKKEPYRKLARSFSEIPSVKLVDDENSRRDDQQQLQMAMCRICEESIHSSLLEVHSKICAMANEEDMRAMNVEDHLRAVAKILLTRSSDIAPEKRKMIIELREIALFAVENGIKENLKMIHIMNDIIKKFDPKDDNRELAIKIQNLISEKVNALKRADDVINSSPRIYRTNSPRILKSPREEELSREIIRGRSRSDSDPVHITMNKNSSGGSTSSITSTNSSSTGNGSIVNEYKPKGVPTISDFEFIKPITKGGYGKVFLAKKIRTGDIYAIKRLKKSDMIKKNQLDHVRVERNILAYTSNPFVVKMYYSFQTKDYYYLVMEYLQGGDCFSLLQMLGALDENMAKMIIAETVLALEYLHSHGIIHRDLKPDNLLIDKNGHIKLTDFGLSKVGLLDKQTVVPPSYFSPTLSSVNGSNSGGTSNSSSTTNNNITMVGGKPINTTIGGSSATGSGITEKKEKKLMSLAQSKSLFSATSSSSPSIPSLNLLNQDKQLSPMMLGLKHQLPMSQLPSISSNTGGVAGQSSTTSSLSSTSSTNSTNTQQTPPLPPQNIHRKLSCVGTPDYLAPEILLGIGHGASADWFSLGVILYEFLCGVSPFSASSVQQTFQNILQRNISWPDDMSPEAKDIIDKLLSLDPKSRLGFNGAEEIKSHPFFKSINWKTILTQEPYFKPKIENLQDTSYFEPRKEIFKVSDDLGESCNNFNNNNNTSPTQLPNSNVNLDSSNYTISQNTNANFDDFLYVNFQSLLELNKNYLAETKPISNHRRRNST